MTAYLSYYAFPCDAFFRSFLKCFLDIIYYPIIVPFLHALLILIISIHSYPFSYLVISLLFNPSPHLVNTLPYNALSFLLVTATLSYFPPFLLILLFYFPLFYFSSPSHSLIRRLHYTPFRPISPSYYFFRTRIFPYWNIMR